MNLSNFRLFSNAHYRPVWRTEQSDWQRVNSTCLFERNFGSTFKLSWTIEGTGSVMYFALVPPYPYEEVLNSTDFFESNCPADAVFYREVLARSLDRRNAEVLTISNKDNFSNEKEERIPNLFPTPRERCQKPNKPVVFVSARVHPGETPASFMLDGLLKTILAPDRRGYLLRKYFIFKIVPVVNPDGVARGYFRVDQNGFNLNRCYQNPSIVDHPTVFAVKTYVEYLSRFNLCFYLDLHAHASRRSCFLFGNCLEDEASVLTQLYAKLVSLNSAYFDWEESDFSERSMSTKDSKDHYSKEGSGRVALYKSTGIVCSYTVECAYFIPRPLHALSPLVSSRTGKKCNDPPYALKNPAAIPVHNRAFFDEVGAALGFSLLDYFGLNAISRLPSSQYRNLENVKEFIVEYNKNRRALTRKFSRNQFQNMMPATKLPRVGPRSRGVTDRSMKRFQSLQPTRRTKPTSKP